MVAYAKYLMIFLFIGFDIFCNARIEEFSITLPAGSKKIDQHRYQSSLSYEDTKRFIDRQLLKFLCMRPIADEINLPHVRAFSYQNFDPRSDFFALNIYQNVLLGLTEIFFVVNPKK